MFPLKKETSGTHHLALTQHFGCTLDLQDPWHESRERNMFDPRTFPLKVHIPYKETAIGRYPGVESKTLGCWSFFPQIRQGAYLASYSMQGKPAWQTHQAIWRGLAYPFSITIIPWRGKNAWVLCVRFFLLWTAFSPANMSSGMVAITRKSIFSWQCGLCQGALWKDLVEHGVPAARDTCPPLSFRWLFQTSLCSPGNLGKMSLGCLFYLFSYLACVHRHELTWAAIFRHFPF